MKHKHRSYLKKHWVVRGLIVLFALFLITVYSLHFTVTKEAKGHIYTNISDVPYRKVAVLLGTKKSFHGKLNKFYYPRIKATAQLYKANKIDMVVVSRNKNNVIRQIKKDLIILGVPENKIYLDFKGITSYDAIYRINKVYGQKKFIVISQNYQLERAIYLAKHYGLHAVAYAAKCERDNNGIKLNFIEKFERLRMFYYIFTKRKPIYFGEKVQIF